MGSSTMLLKGLFAAFGCLIISANTGYAQNIQTSNQFIAGVVDMHSGLVTVFLPPGRPGYDPQLSFFHKSYFTCQIGAAFFTNNEVIAPLPQNVKLLEDGTTTKIDDTIRTVWTNKNGIDIIQDVYPVALGQGGQIVEKWNFFNNGGALVAIGCQYLNDIQITDPNDTQIPNSNDGPVLLIADRYETLWQQYPDTTGVIPQTYTGFLHTLPNAPAFNPGLTAKGYLDFGAPLNLIKPSRVTVGDWYSMTQSLYGQGPSWQYNIPYGTLPSMDNAVLIEFQSESVPSGENVEIGRTSYGTDIGDSAAGNSAGAVFYPRLLAVDKGTKHFSPHHVESFFHPESATRTQTLTVGPMLEIVGPPPAYLPIGKTHTFTTSSTRPYFSWYLTAESGYPCSGDVASTVTFTSSEGTFEYPVIIQCPAAASVPSMRSTDPLLLGPNHPNPFSHITSFTYNVAEQGMVKLSLFDELGKEVARIVGGEKAQGSYIVDFDGSKLPAGNYIIRLQIGEKVASRKVVIER